MFYYTSDLHFDHKKILEYCERPYADVEEMNEALIENWNSRVKATDTVYILGDLCFGSGKTASGYLKRLRGHKFLIRGNHDLFLSKSTFDTSLVEGVYSLHTVLDPFIDKRIVLCHFPLAVWDKQQYGALHFYGHVHQCTDADFPILYQLKNSYNVGVDVHNYFPMTAEEIVQSGRK